MFDYRSSKRAAADQAHTALPPRIQYEILRFDYTVSSRKLQQHRRRETLKNQEVEKVKGRILEIIESISNLEQLRAIYNFAVYILTK